MKKEVEKGRGKSAALSSSLFRLVFLLHVPTRGAGGARSVVAGIRTAIGGAKSRLKGQWAWALRGRPIGGSGAEQVWFGRTEMESLVPEATFSLIFALLSIRKYSAIEKISAVYRFMPKFPLGIDTKGVYELRRSF